MLVFFRLLLSFTFFPPVKNPRLSLTRNSVLFSIHTKYMGISFESTHSKNGINKFIGYLLLKNQDQKWCGKQLNIKFLLQFDFVILVFCISFQEILPESKATAEHSCSLKEKRLIWGTFKGKLQANARNGKQLDLGDKAVFLINCWNYCCGP